MKSYFLFLILILGFYACKFENTTQNEKNNKNDAKSLDKFEIYLSKDSNVDESNYIPYFLNRYNQLLNLNKLDSAGKLLGIVGRTLNYNSINNPQIKDIGLTFLKKYSDKISEELASEISYNIGSYYYYSDNYDSSTYFYNKSIIDSDTYESKSRNGMANYNLLFSTLNNGGQDSSIKFAHKALKIFEDIKDSSMQGAVYSGIACVYNFQDNYARALKYEQKAYDIAVKSKDTSIIMVVSLNKINTYNSFDHPNLYSFIDSTYHIYKNWSEKNLTKNENDMKSWLALKAVNDNKLNLAKKYLDEIKSKLKLVDDNVSENYYYNALAEYDLKVGSNSENIKIYKDKIVEKKENEDYLSLSLYYQILHDHALKNKDFENAEKYLNEAEIAEDSLASISIKNKVSEFEEKYQTEKKEQQIALQKSEISKKNTYLALLATSIAGLFLVALVYFLWQKQKQLHQEKSISMNFTKQLLETTEVERKRIATDLHDSISHELLNLKSIFSQDIGVINSKIDTIINDIRSISRNLHPVMFEKIGLVPNIDQLIERVQAQNDFMVNTEINYSGTLTSADELQIYRIIQEALTNVIKYAKAYAAKITINEDTKCVWIEIKDNGLGFNVKETLNSSKAFGLHNIIERSRAIGGLAQIESSAAGTVITIRIPKKL